MYRPDPWGGHDAGAPGSRWRGRRPNCLRPIPPIRMGAAPLEMQKGKSRKSPKATAALVPPRSVVSGWFDGLEETLTREADLAGLLNHRSMVGAGREFFVGRVLRSILPPTAHVGEGRVIGVG